MPFTRIQETDRRSFPYQEGMKHSGVDNRDAIADALAQRTALVRFGGGREEIKQIVGGGGGNAIEA